MDRQRANAALALGAIEGLRPEGEDGRRVRGELRMKEESFRGDWTESSTDEREREQSLLVDELNDVVDGVERETEEGSLHFLTKIVPRQ